MQQARLGETSAEVCSHARRAISSDRMRVVLVNPPSDCVEDDRLEPPLGLLYIAAYLHEQGYAATSVHDMAGCRDAHDVDGRMMQIPEADAYGISCLSTTYAYAKRAIARIREVSPHAHITIGGPHPSGLPEPTHRDSGADLVVGGPGEVTFTRALDALAGNSSLLGVVAGEALGDIDAYPFPARDLVDMDSYSRRLLGEPVVSLVTSRGCQHHCVHCNSVAMRGRVQHRSVANVMAEMRSLREKHRMFRFNDDHFTGRRDLVELLERVRELDVLFRASARIEDLTERNCRALKQAGCVQVAIGLESLNPDNLRAIGKAGQIGAETNLQIARSLGLCVRSSFMVGLPYDTDETIERYFGIAAEIGVTEFAVYALIPYPGTQLWEHPERFGYAITDRDFTRYVQMGHSRQTCCVLRHANFGPEDVERWKQRAEAILESGGSAHMSNSDVAR